MMRFLRDSVIMTAALALCVAYGFGCANCDEPEPVESGQYVLSDGGNLGLTFAWLVGAQMDIDREAETATLRYTRDGTTYDVMFTLTHL